MSVYVDSAFHRFWRMKMCHMIADTLEELHAMADRIGVDRRWFQAKASFPHYDVCKSKRTLAVKAGAIECHRKEFVTHLRRIRDAAMIKQWDRTLAGAHEMRVGDTVTDQHGQQFVCTGVTK